MVTVQIYQNHSRQKFTQFSVDCVRNLRSDNQTDFCVIHYNEIIDRRLRSFNEDFFLCVYT
jgi:hypothetical protein